MSEIDIDALLKESAQAAADFDAAETKQEDWESNQADLQDRQALRRVAGLSTELQDISDAEYRQLRIEKVVLVGVWTEGTIQDAENSLKELSALAETAGSEVLDGLIQRRDRPDPAIHGCLPGRRFHSVSQRRRPLAAPHPNRPWQLSLLRRETGRSSQA